MSAACVRTVGLLICLGLLPSAVWSVEYGDYDWELKRERKDIKIYLSKVPDSKFRAIRAQMVVDTPINSLIALATDLANCKQWVAMCQEARIVERRSPLESIVYTHNNVPFPVRDREIYSHVMWSKDPITGRIIMRSEAIDDPQYESNKRRIRIVYAVSEWRFTPLPNNRVAVESFAHVDPNGAVPAWLINLLIVDAPYKTFKAMRRLAQTPRYNQAQISLFD